jgi:hypothetical protein
MVVYGFYCNLKGVKSKEDMPDTSVPRKYVEPLGKSTSHIAPANSPKTEEEQIHEDVRMQNFRNNLNVMLPGSSTSPRAPALQPKRGEQIYEDVRKHNARNNLHSDAAKAEEGEVYAVYDYTLPGRFSEA